MFPFFEFLIEYEYYRNLFKTTGAKVYVHSLTYEKNIAPIRQALEDCGGKILHFKDHILIVSALHIFNNLMKFYFLGVEILKTIWIKNVTISKV